MSANSSGSVTARTSKIWNWFPYSAAASSPASARKPARRTGRARAYMPYSSCKHTQPSRNRPRAYTKPPSITRNSAKAIAGTAASTRADRSERRLRRSRRRGRELRARAAISRGSPPAEAPAALRELGQRFLEGLAGEVGPQLLAEHELGVGRLPQQVVRKPLLSAGADDQVRVVHLGRVQAAAELLLGAAHGAASGIEDLRPPAVVEGHEQRDPAVSVGQLLGPAHALDELLRDALPSPQEAHPHPLLVQLRGLIGDPPREHVHEALHLGRWAGPVLGREGVHRELLDAQ